MILIDFRYIFAFSDFKNNFFEKDSKEEPWHITADKIIYDQNFDEYTAIGNVIVAKMHKKLTAGFILFKNRTMELFARDHVVMTVGEDILSGMSMEINLATEIGTIYDGSIFFRKNHFFIKGSKIKKLNEASYDIDKVTVTTCDGDNPDWKITGNNLNLTIEGYAKLRHATFWTKNIPSLYFPYFIFPAKQKRQTGLLLPDIAYSEQKGTEYLQPIYYAINESSDATLYAHYMSRRGKKIGFEYRHVVDINSKSTFIFDYFNDKLNNQDRLNYDRYWFRMKYDYALPNGFFSKLDFDIVSDKDYLSEFKSWSTGFDDTNNYFKNIFNRELDDYTDPVRINRLNINKSWRYYNLNAEARWYDNVINRRDAYTDNTTQKLPFISFVSSKQPVLNSMLYFNFNSEYTHFYRQTDSNAHRIDLNPRFSLPVRLWNAIVFEPSAGFRDTIWFDDNLQNDQIISRQIYDIKLDLSTELFKIFNININSIDRIKNVIRPQLIYEYIPDITQEKFPIFDQLDRIQPKNILTYPITIILTSRSNIPSVENIPNYSYNEFCRIKFEQSYNIDESRSNKEDRKPFSPIYAEFTFTPSVYCAIKADATWSVYDKSYETHNLGLYLSDKRGDRISLEHRYAISSNESIFISLQCPVTNYLIPYAEYERNLFEETDIKTILGFLYNSQCWSIDIRYKDEVYDRRYEFLVNLYGLGGIKH
ncbi:MAG: LPS-assembly protein LptD [Desulfobacterales bacterium]|nr:LPS-assembly protein LptD [Desulfobacterales bacterium]